MSRIGKQPIPLEQGVDVKLTGNIVETTESKQKVADIIDGIKSVKS